MATEFRTVSDVPQNLSNTGLPDVVQAQNVSPSPRIWYAFQTDQPVPGPDAAGHFITPASMTYWDQVNAGPDFLWVWCNQGSRATLAISAVG